MKELLIKIETALKLLENLVSNEDITELTYDCYKKEALEDFYEEVKKLLEDTK